MRGFGINFQLKNRNIIYKAWDMNRFMKVEPSFDGLFYRFQIKWTKPNIFVNEVDE
jgi:hypothetical protein